jgi:hypothetical protein
MNFINHCLITCSSYFIHLFLCFLVNTIEEVRIYCEENPTDEEDTDPEALNETVTRYGAIPRNVLRAEHRSAPTFTELLSAPLVFSTVPGTSGDQILSGL